MITDEEISKIYEWADKYGIKNKGKKESNRGNFGTKLWVTGIPKRKENLLDIENLRLCDGYDDKSIISEIPKELFKLPKLKFLDISDLTELTSLSNHANSLTGLIYHNINIDNAVLNNIEYLSIEAWYWGDRDNKQYAKLDDDFFMDVTFNHLKQLNLISLNNTKCFFKHAKKFPQLESLLIHRDDTLNEIPDTLSNLVNLEELDLYDTGITKLPPDIGKLKKLKYLNLSYCNNLLELPEEVGNLINLKELDIRDSGIKKLPNTLSNLVNLELYNGEPYLKFHQIKDQQSLTEKSMTDLDSTSNKKIFSTQKIGSIGFPHKNILLKGVPGTGKSRAIEKIITEKLELEGHEGHRENILRINIHSASSNADLMQGIGISSSGGQIEYKEKQGLILNIIEKATFHPEQPFVLIMEEIQENSLNELIGDLIYLIDENKRTKNIVADDEKYEYQELVERLIEQHPDAAYVKIPYLVDESTKYRKMIMPDNLYIFCTSNYRDDKKVIEDNLLRRFEVLEVYPKHDVVYVEYQDFFKKLNENILNVLKDEIHPDRFLIGHSNWIIKDENKDKIDKKQNFYRAFLKIVVEFKDVKEIEFDDFKKIAKDIALPNEATLTEWSTYKDLITEIQKKAGYDFLD